MLEEVLGGSSGAVAMAKRDTRTSSKIVFLEASVAKAVNVFT